MPRIPSAEELHLAEADRHIREAEARLARRAEIMERPIPGGRGAWGR